MIALFGLTVVFEGLDLSPGQSTAQDQRGVVQLVTQDQTTLDRRY